MKQVLIEREERVLVYSVCQVSDSEAEEMRNMNPDDLKAHLGKKSLGWIVEETLEELPVHSVEMTGENLLPQNIEQSTSLSDRCRELMEEAAQVIEKEVKRIGGISEDTHPELNFWSYRLNVENVGGISPDGKCTDGHLKGDDVREMMRDNDIQFSDWIELADNLKKIEA